MAQASHKLPPSLKTSKCYEDWTKLIKIWQKVTNLDPVKQGPAVALVLEGEAQQAILELSSDELSAADGLDKIITRLDKIYAKDELVQKFTHLESFENYKRSSKTSMQDFLTEFELRHNKMKKDNCLSSTKLSQFARKR